MRFLQIKLQCMFTILTILQDMFTFVAVPPPAVEAEFKNIDSPDSPSGDAALAIAPLGWIRNVASPTLTVSQAHPQHKGNLASPGLSEPCRNPFKLCVLVVYQEAGMAGLE